ncbi:hypothetical protein GJ744_009110 [Endocarpon pusillum]|uniref:Mannosyl-oligosaccharide glucosidase n=1 Tax=Endocarpon pusillum TaxID=364733 RepID=A0A8H7AK32_9EURO|nr:hypothetical protein GJ744_009110 [Endocarpon pusillum]
MVIQRLLEIAQVPGPYQQKARDIYTNLRLNLVNTVFNSWKKTGFAWEQYNPATGKGQRTWRRLRRCPQIAVAVGW